MKKILLSLALFSCFSAMTAQDKKEEKEEQKQGWTKEGNISLLFNQSAFNADWTGGGPRISPETSFLTTISIICGTISPGTIRS